MSSDLVFNNWLVNTTGKPDAFLEVDLLQEHLNYWIKVRLYAVFSILVSQLGRITMPLTAVTLPGSGSRR